MIDSERSTGTLLLGLLAAGLLGASLAAPWFHYESSTGRRTPAGGFQDPSDTGAIHHRLTMAPYAQSGDAQPTHPEDARQLRATIGALAATATGCLALVALGGVPFLSRAMPRRLSLALATLGALCILAALLAGWVWLPQTMDGYGVDGPFTSKVLEDGYIRTTLGGGWVAAGLALPFVAGAFLFQFQAGSNDPRQVEAFARPQAKQGAH
ncbi:MAG: hypothetical protein LC620_05375 [Halobacteriales archaeon]|nr:hypothetical protein [Halobacteriales archaeon]